MNTIIAIVSLLLTPFILCGLAFWMLTRDAFIHIIKFVITLVNKRGENNAKLAYSKIMTHDNTRTRKARPWR